MDIIFKRNIKNFFLPIIILLIWLGCMFYFELFHCFKDNWPIAVAMILGSFVAGSTPVGGGTVGYPVMVLFFSISPLVACDFSLAIQSVGMGMATFSILLNKERLEWTIIKIAFIGGVIGFIAGTEINHLIPINHVKISFAVLWVSFIIYNFFKKRKKEKQKKERSLIQSSGYVLLIGIIGGGLASLIGSGIDMLLFILITHHFGVGYKNALRTSIVIMTMMSIFGIAYKGLVVGFGDQQQIAQLFDLWIVCVPIVAFGAPLGAMVVRGRKELTLKRLLYFVVLCQVFFSYVLIEQTLSLIIYQLIVIGLFYIILSIKFIPNQRLKSKEVLNN